MAELTTQTKQNIAATQFTVGIIGGGNGGKMMIDLLKNVAKIKYIIDKNLDAPGMVYAKEFGIKTLTEIEEIKKNETEFIIEATGSQKIIDMINSLKTNGTELITHRGAKLLSDAMDTKAQKGACTQIQALLDKNEQNLQNIKHINKINRETNVFFRNLAINSSVLAAKANDNAFEVIAKKMKEIAEKGQEMNKQIEDFEREMVETQNEIQEVMRTSLQK